MALKLIHDRNGAENIELSPNNVIYHHHDRHFKLPRVNILVNVERSDMLPQTTPTPENGWKPGHDMYYMSPL